MAYQINDRFNEDSQVTIICDSEADVANLPTSVCPGSIAIVATADGGVYMLNASYQWEAI